MEASKDSEHRTKAEQRRAQEFHTEHVHRSVSNLNSPQSPQSPRTEGSASQFDFTTNTDAASLNPGLEIPQTELFTHQSGILAVNLLDGHVTSANCRIELVVDDLSWPSFSSLPARTNKAKWNFIGEAFIRELGGSLRECQLLLTLGRLQQSSTSREQWRYGRER